MKKNINIFILRAVLLFLFWIILSGKLEPFHVAVGFVLSLSIAWMSFGVNLESLTNMNFFKLMGIVYRSLAYAAWLLKCVVQAAFHVSKLIIKKQMPINPKIIQHRTFLKTDIEKVIFCQSITLTPGTITADIQGDLLTIHSLDAASSGDIENGFMEKQIEKIFQTGGNS